MSSLRILDLAHLPGSAATVDPRHKDGVTDLRRIFILRKTNDANLRHVSKVHLHVPTLQERSSWHMNLQINDGQKKHIKGISMSDRELHNILGVGDRQLDRSADRFDDITINRTNQFLSYAFPYLRAKSLLSPKLYAEMFNHDSLRELLNWIMSKKYRDGLGEETVTLSDYFLRMFEFEDMSIQDLTQAGKPFARFGGGWSACFGVWVHGLIYLRFKHALNPSFNPTIHEVFKRVFHMHGVEPSIQIEEEWGIAEKRKHLKDFCIDPFSLLKHGSQPYIQTDDFIFTRSIGFAPLNCDAIDHFKSNGTEVSSVFSLTNYRIVFLVRTGFFGNSRVDFPVRLRDDDILYVFFEGSSEMRMENGRIVDPIIKFAESVARSSMVKIDHVEPVSQRIRDRILFRHYDATFQDGMPHVRYRDANFSNTGGKIGRVNIPDASPLRLNYSQVLNLHYSNSEITSSLGVEVIRMVRAALRAALNHVKTGGQKHTFGDFTVNLNSVIQPMSHLIQHINTMPKKCSIMWKRVLMVYLSLIHNATVPLILAPIIQSLDHEVLMGTFLNLDLLTDRLMWNLITNWSFIFLEFRPVNFAMAWKTLSTGSDEIFVDKHVYGHTPVFATKMSVLAAREFALKGLPVSKELVLKITSLMCDVVEEKESRVSAVFNVRDAYVYNNRSLV